MCVIMSCTMGHDGMLKGIRLRQQEPAQRADGASGVAHKAVGRA